MACTCDSGFLGLFPKHREGCKFGPQPEFNLYKIIKTPPKPEKIELQVDLGDKISIRRSVNIEYPYYQAIYASLDQMEQFHKILGLAIKEAKDG